MSIQLTDQVATLFSQGDWRKALKILCADKTSKANKALREIDPCNSTGVAKLQEEIRQLDKLLCIEDAVIEFEEKQAASKITQK